MPLVGANNTALTDAVVPMSLHIGLQNIDLLEAHLVIATAEEITKFCSNGGISVWNFSSVLPSILVLPEWENSQTMNCNGAFGSWTNLEFFKNWCYLGAAVIVRLDMHQYPGIFANGHPVDFYHQFIDNNPGINSCAIFDSRIRTTPEALRAASDGTVSLHSDVNQALKLFSSPMVRSIFILNAALYFYIAIYATYLFHLRYKRNKLTNTHRNVLLLNMVTMSILGFIEAAGNKWIGGSLIPESVIYAFYSGLIASTLAGDLFLSILFSTAKHGTFIQTKTAMRNKIFYRVAVSLIAVEIVLCVMTALARDNNFMYIFVVISIPMTLVIMQISTSLFMFIQARSIINHVQLTQVLRNSKGTSNNNNLMFQLGSNLKFCTYLSVASTAASVTGLMSFTFNGIPYSSPGEWIAFCLLMNISNIGSSYSQVQACMVHVPRRKNMIGATLALSSQEIIRSIEYV